MTANPLYESQLHVMDLHDRVETVLGFSMSVAE